MSRGPGSKTSERITVFQNRPRVANGDRVSEIQAQESCCSVNGQAKQLPLKNSRFAVDIRRRNVAGFSSEVTGETKMEQHCPLDALPSNVQCECPDKGLYRLSITNCVPRRGTTTRVRFSTLLPSESCHPFWCKSSEK